MAVSWCHVLPVSSVLRGGLGQPFCISSHLETLCHGPQGYVTLLKTSQIISYLYKAGVLGNLGHGVWAVSGTREPAGLLH